MAVSMNVGGLSSGIQWNDIVDTTIQLLEARTVTPVSDRITQRNKQKDAWTALQTLVNNLNSAALAVRRTGLGGFKASTPTSSSSGRGLISAAPTSTATAGRYRVEVVQLAETSRLAGASFADVSAVRDVSGSFTLNGKTIAVDASDSLTLIRDRINLADAGVTATIISEGGTAGKLVLTNNSSGASQIDIGDGAEGLARSLGLLDSRSGLAASATVAAASAMGLSVNPSPASIRIGDRTIMVDLENESIATIAMKIRAAGGSASVEAEPYGDQTRYRLVIDGNVSTVDGDPNSQAVIDALGITAGGFGTVRQTVQTSTFTEAGGGPASSATLLTALGVDGVPAEVAVGDAINIRGTRGDGTSVSYGIVVGAGDTVQSLINRINDANAGFGAGSRTATAELGFDGRILLTDDTGGASRMTLSLTITHADGTSGALGATSTSVTGRSRELQQGRDAIVLVDGQQYTRSSNTFSDVVSGVAITLRSAEPGTTTDLAIERDEGGAVDATRKLVDAYNEIRKFFDEQRQPDAPLYADSNLRGIISSFTSALRTEVTGNPAYGRAVNVGLILDREGRLTFSEDTFRKAFADKPTEVEALFGLAGLGGAFVVATDSASRYGEGPISTSINSIIENVHGLQSREAELRKRLEDRRQQLVEQYTRMEESLSRLQQQSGSLLASIQALQPRQK